MIDPLGIGNVVSEYNASGQLTGHLVQGLGLTSFLDSSGVAQYFAFDVLGSTVGITGTDGALESQFSYLPFGELSSSTGPLNSALYVGALGAQQEANGLIEMRARFYDPVLGRFLSADPISFLKPEINVYTYVGNQPTYAFDPTGLKTVSIGIGISAGAGESGSRQASPWFGTARGRLLISRLPMVQEPAVSAQALGGRYVHRCQKCQPVGRTKQPSWRLCGPRTG